MAIENNISEEQIIKGCRAHDLEMQKAFYRLYGPEIMGVCMRYLKPRENAEEVFHDVVLKIYENLHKYKGQGSLKGWCRRVAVNSCLDFIRKNKNQLRLNYIEEQTIEVEDTVDDLAALKNANVDEVIKFMDDLPGQQQLVLNLFIVDGYSHKAIADQLFISEGASRNLLQRAKLNLKKKLGINNSLTRVNENTK